MQWRRCYTIKIGGVASNDCAQLREVEETIFNLQGVEGPFHTADASPQSLIALKKFEPPSDALIAILRVDGQHVGVQIGPALGNARQCHGKTHQAVGLAPWARAWQQKTRDEEVIRLLAIDQHSPGEFRCNQIVRNLNEFYDAFEVTANDALFLPEGDRVRIW